MTAPLALSPRRITVTVAASAPIPTQTSPLLRRRLATAARQETWRRLRGQRALAPVVVVEADRLTLVACYLDGARAPGAAAAMLAALAAPAAVTRWLRQAGG